MKPNNNDNINPDEQLNASGWTELDGYISMDQIENKKNGLMVKEDLPPKNKSCYHLLENSANNSKHSRKLAVFIVILRLFYGMVGLTLKPLFSLCYAIYDVVIGYKLKQKNDQSKLYRTQLISRVLISFFLLCAYILSILFLFYNPLSQAAVLGAILKPTLSMLNFQVPIMLMLIFFISGLSDAVFCILKFSVPKNSSYTNNPLIPWRKVKLFFMAMFAFFLGDQGTAIIYENYILSDLRKQYMATTGKKALYYLSMLTLQPQRRQTGSDQEIISLFRRFVK